MTWKNKTLLAAYENLDPKLQKEVLHFLEYMKLRQDDKLNLINETRYLAKFEAQNEGLLLIEDEPN
ncbi:MAG: hypothetical protein AB8H47_22825 [Bacteroidia bacterium]